MNCLKIAAALSILISTETAKAQSQLVFTPSHGNDYRLFLDGKAQHPDGHRGIFVLKNLPEGNYQLMVQTLDKNHPCANPPSVYIEVGRLKNIVFQQQSDCRIVQQDIMPISKSVLPPNISNFSYTNTGEFGSGSNQINPQPLTNSNLDSKRTGTFKMVEFTDENGISRLIPADSVEFYQQQLAQKKAVTEAPVVSITKLYRYYTDPSSQKTSVVEEKSVVTKALVEKNGQKFYKTNEEIVITPTNFRCPPMSDADFLTFYTNFPNFAQNADLYANKCFQNEQIEKILSLLSPETQRQAAPWLENSCAEPTAGQESGCAALRPLLAAPKVEIPSEQKIVKEDIPNVTNNTKEEIKPVPTPEPAPKLSKKEEKAALKALKKKQKEELKAMKAAQKAAAKAK